MTAPIKDQASRPAAAARQAREKPFGQSRITSGKAAAPALRTKYPPR
ncbi:hypothetical protein AB0D29_20975 [Streptomyces sp. NPDC048424]